MRCATLLAVSMLLLLLLASPASHARELCEVPAGRFTMGSVTGDPDERPVRQVQLAAYAIDCHEVTQGAYAQCVTAKVCTKPKSYPGPEGAELPVVGVTWQDAERYCRWRGKRLPSEAEWERAARGTDGRTYTWGEGLDCSKANFGNYAGAGLCAGQNPGRVLPVGSRPAGRSPAGAQDMAGNVWEWVADRYQPYGKAGQLSQPRSWRVVRGGSCCSYFAMPTTTNRLAFPASYADRDLGFRCARSSSGSGSRPR